MIKSHSEFQPLKEVVVGQGYPVDYFDCIADNQTRDTLQTIFGEIEEDFQNFVKTLESFGVKTVRPGILSKKSFESSVKHNHAIVPPITPRDRQGVYGNKLVKLSGSGWNNFSPLINHYQAEDPENVIIPRGVDADIISGANASCVYRMGRDIWFDQSDWLTPAQSDWMITNVFKDSRYRFHKMHTNGHSDCVFSVLKPGVILTSLHDAGVAYAKDFPGWNIHRVNNPSVERYHQFRNDLHPGDKWWVPGKDNLDNFRNYVDQYLNHWIGEIHETVFDVNCLSIDTEHVIFACYNKDVFDYCEANGITPILCDLRHRFFFDGGTHCCTLDIHREGELEDYL